MRTSTQLKALISNLSSKSNVEAEILLRNFMMERFLERIAVSNYKHNFISWAMVINAVKSLVEKYSHSSDFDMDLNCYVASTWLMFN